MSGLSHWKDSTCFRLGICFLVHFFCIQSFYDYLSLQDYSTHSVVLHIMNEFLPVFYRIYCRTVGPTVGSLNGYYWVTERTGLCCALGTGSQSSESDLSYEWQLQMHLHFMYCLQFFVRKLNKRFTSFYSTIFCAVLSCAERSVRSDIRYFPLFVGQ